MRVLTELVVLCAALCAAGQKVEAPNSPLPGHLLDPADFARHVADGLHPYHDGSSTEECASRDTCVLRAGAPCTLEGGALLGSPLLGSLKCAAPMVCKAVAGAPGHQGRCVRSSDGLTCDSHFHRGLLYGGQSCMHRGYTPTLYCREGRCREPPSLPGDVCFNDDQCTSGATCDRSSGSPFTCKGVQPGFECDSDYRLCDRGLFCNQGRCEAWRQRGDACSRSLLDWILSGATDSDECAPGLSCRNQKCQLKEEAGGELGQPCELHYASVREHKGCRAGLYCHRRGNETRGSCRTWPKNLWKPCKTAAECEPGQVCNCKVGGLSVCELPGEENESVESFLMLQEESIHQCALAHHCYSGLSAYPRGAFNSRSCVWTHCRHMMAGLSYNRYCTPNAIPSSRRCVQREWCEELRHWMLSSAPVQHTAPPVLVEALGAGGVAGIVIGVFVAVPSLAGVGFVCGWFVRKFKEWKRDDTAMSLVADPSINL